MTSNPYIPEGVDKEMEEILQECYLDTKYFCKVFMPKTFWKPFSKGHDELFKILDDDSIQKAAIALPRGWGKTSIVNKAYPAKKIVFQDRHYIVPISSTSSSAKEFSENLKMELLYNEDLTDVFGPIRSSNMGRDAGPFSTQEWITSTDIKVMPRGAGQQIRGRLYKNHRPDLFLVDDIEDDEAVESDERREKLTDWFLSAVRNSIEVGDSRWRIIVIGTILHEDSLLANLISPDKHQDWTKLRLELCDDNYHSNWPDHMSDKQVRLLADEYRNAGKLSIFYREFRNIPIAKEDQGFKEEYFQYYKETEDELNQNPDVESLVLADPAKTMKVGSANTAIVGVSVNTRENKYYVRDVIEAKLHPDELYEKMFELADRINALVLAPEVTSLNEYITYPLRNAMIKSGKHYIIVEVKPREGKTGPKRSGGLVPLYRTGLVYHNKMACGALEKYLMQWPRPAKWDIIDAFAGMIFALDEGERYFTPRDSDDDIEAEYAELDYEPPLEYEPII